MKRKGKKKKKKLKRGKKRAKYLKIWAKMYKMWQYFEKRAEKVRRGPELSTSYEMYSSSLFNGGKSHNISRKHWVSMMVYFFWHKSFKYSAITLLQFYVKVPVWSLMLNLWVLVGANNFAGSYATGLIFSYFS